MRSLQDARACSSCGCDSGVGAATPGTPDPVKHEEQAGELERDAERLEEQGERVEQHIDDARSDWEGKEHDSSVPGAQPDPGEEEESVRGAETDPEEVDEEGGP